MNVFITSNGDISFKINKNGYYINFSLNGQITEFGTLGNGEIKYDYKGRVIQVGTLVISYDTRGYLESIGNTILHYEFYKDRIDKIGNLVIHRDFSQDYIDKIDNIEIHYGFYDNKVDKIGNSTIKYNSLGLVEKINDDDGIVIFKNSF